MGNDVYIGIKYPIENSTNGNYVALTRTGREAVKSNLTFLLSTQRGEVLFKPDFGIDIQQFLFEPLDENTINEIKNEVISTIEVNFKGLSIDNINVGVNDQNYLLSLQINFSYNEGIFVVRDIIEVSF